MHIHHREMSTWIRPWPGTVQYFLCDFGPQLRPPVCPCRYKTTPDSGLSQSTQCAFGYVIAEFHYENRMVLDPCDPCLRGWGKRVLLALAKALESFPKHVVSRAQPYAMLTGSLSTSRAWATIFSNALVGFSAYDSYSVDWKTDGVAIAGYTSLSVATCLPLASHGIMVLRCLVNLLASSNIHIRSEKRHLQSPHLLG